MAWNFKNIIQEVMNRKLFLYKESMSERYQEKVHFLVIYDSLGILIVFLLKRYFISNKRMFL